MSKLLALAACLSLAAPVWAVADDGVEATFGEAMQQPEQSAEIDPALSFAKTQVLPAGRYMNCDPIDQTYHVFDIDRTGRIVADQMIPSQEKLAEQRSQPKPKHNFWPKVARAAQWVNNGFPTSNSVGAPVYIQQAPLQYFQPYQPPLPAMQPMENPALNSLINSASLNQMRRLAGY